MKKAERKQRAIEEYKRSLFGPNYAESRKEREPNNDDLDLSPRDYPHDSFSDMMAA
jgi:hypothetical protein